MKKSCKSIITLLFVVIFLSQASILAFASSIIPDPTKDFYVNDFSGIFTEEEKSDLMNRALELSNSAEGIQVVVTTVKSLDGETVENYANKMYNQYGIGKDDMGVLILLSTGDRKIRVEIGKAMESYITDSKAGRLIDDYAISNLKENKFNTGLISLQTAIIDEINNSIKNEKAKESDSGSDLTSTPESKEPINIPFELIISVIAFLILLGIVIYIFYRKSVMIRKLEAKNEKLIKENSRLKEETRTVSELRQKLQRSLENYSSLNTNFEKLFDRYVRAQALFPNVDELIDKMIENEKIESDKQKAKVVNDKINKVLTLSATKDHVQEFNQVLLQYNALTTDQKSYVVDKIDNVRNLHSKSIELLNKDLAASATQKINSLISNIHTAKERDLHDLNSAKRIFDSLNADAQKYVDLVIIQNISQLLDEANRDKRHNEDEARRRREEDDERNRQNSYSSNDDSFGGFGGSSGGGGASRDF